MTQNLNGLGAKVSSLMSLQAVKRLQLDQMQTDFLLVGITLALVWIEGSVWRSLYYHHLFLYLLFTSLHFDVYCYSFDTFQHYIYVTSVWLCSKMQKKFSLPLSCASGHIICAHCKHMYVYITSSTQGKTVTMND